MADTYETLIYHQKQAFLDWKSSVGASTRGLSRELENNVWDLMVLCADNLTGPSIEVDEEISQAAYDLAATLLETSSIRDVDHIYRNALIESVLRHLPQVPNETERMLHFANLLSDSYREAYADRLHRTIIRQRASRLSEELQLAKRIQNRLLPRTIPKIPGFQVAGRLIPAAEVGGDYWSCKYYEEDGIVTMKLADITGHGIAAATLVAAVKFISGGYYRGSASAHDVIERTNRTLVAETPVEILVTMVYGWLYPETREVDIVNAGHSPVFVCTQDKCIDLPPTGPVLGVTDTEYGEQRIRLDDGDILFFGSDGLTEAGIAEPFGTARVKELVFQNKHRTADEIADAMIQAVTDYAGQPHDDMSLVVLKTIGDKAA